MRPEPPIFLFDEDGTFLDVRRVVQDAERHLSGEHGGGGGSAAELLAFDGLARPVEVRLEGDRVRLVVSQPVPDVWQLRARVDRALRRRRQWLEEQGKEIVLPGGREVSQAEVDGALRALDGIDTFSSFAEVAVALADAFEPEVMEHSGSFLHNLFHAW